MDYLASFIMVGLFALYVHSLYPEISGGDTGELLSAACEFGVAHPPGYPLFTILSALTIKMSNYGSPAWRVNLLNAFFSALAGGILAHVVHKQTSQISSAILIVALFSVNRLTWTWSVAAEVFSLNNLFLAILLYLSFTLDKVSHKKKLKVAYKGAFVCALALCNQHTCVIYLIFLIPWTLIKLFQHRLLNIWSLFVLTWCFLMGLLPYMYLPVSSYRNTSRWTWGDQRTFSGFFTHLTRAEYGTFDLGKDEEGLGLLNGLKIYVIHQCVTLTPITPVLFLLSTWSAASRMKNRLSCTLVHMVMVLSYVVFFSWRANLNVSNPLMLGVVERFWMQSDLVIAFLAALTYGDMTASIKFSFFRQMFHFFAVVALVFQVHRNYNRCNKSNNTVVYDFSLSVMEGFPPNSTVLTRGDLSSTTFHYLHLCNNVRPDLKMFDQELLTYEWSVPMLRHHHPGIIFPGDFLHLENKVYSDGTISFNFLKFLDANYKNGPIFACIGVQEHEPSWQTDYDIWPYGVCSQFIKKISRFGLKKWVKKAGYIAFNWTHPHNGFPDTSWEKVATDEMWNAKINLPLYLYENAEQTSNPKEKKRLLLNAYTLYMDAVTEHQDFPMYWHKNYALVCTKLLNIEHDLDKELLLRKSIFHLQTYVNSDPVDDQLSNIVEAIKSLKRYGRQLGIRSNKNKKG